MALTTVPRVSWVWRTALGEHDGGDAFFGVFQGAAAQKGIPGEGVIEGIRNGGYDAGYVFESMQHIEEAGGETTD